MRPYLKPLYFVRASNASGGGGKSGWPEPNEMRPLSSPLPMKKEGPGISFDIMSHCIITSLKWHLEILTRRTSYAPEVIHCPAPCRKKTRAYNPRTAFCGSWGLIPPLCRNGKVSGEIQRTSPVVRKRIFPSRRPCSASAEHVLKLSASGRDFILFRSCYERSELQILNPAPFKFKRFSVVVYYFI